jgi:hypothetical protein
VTDPVDQLRDLLHDICYDIDPQMFREPHASDELVKWAKVALKEQREACQRMMRDFAAMKVACERHGVLLADITMADADIVAGLKAQIREAKLDAERAKAERNAIANEMRKRFMRGLERMSRPVNPVEWKNAQAESPDHAPWWLVADHLMHNRRKDLGMPYTFKSIRLRRANTRDPEEYQALTAAANEEKPIPVAQLKNNHVYEIDSRNLSLGVWDQMNEAFVGIRTKFGSRYLAGENPAELGGPHGTATAYAHVGPLPEGVDIADEQAVFNHLEQLENGK